MKHLGGFGCSFPGAFTTPTTYFDWHFPLFMCCFTRVREWNRDRNTQSPILHFTFQFCNSNDDDVPLLSPANRNAAKTCLLWFVTCTLKVRQIGKWMKGIWLKNANSDSNIRQRQLTSKFIRHEKLQNIANWFYSKWRRRKNWNDLWYIFHIVYQRSVWLPISLESTLKPEFIDQVDLIGDSSEDADWFLVLAGSNLLSEWHWEHSNSKNKIDKMMPMSKHKNAVKQLDHSIGWPLRSGHTWALAWYFFWIELHAPVSENWRRKKLKLAR